VVLQVIPAAQATPEAVATLGLPGIRGLVVLWEILEIPDHLDQTATRALQGIREHLAQAEIRVALVMAVLFLA
jgi:hypothetical protein